MIAVTTFSATGYTHYAKAMLKSMVEHWPTKIIVYSESPIDLKHEKIEERDFFGIEAVPTFYQYLKNVPLAMGKTPKGYNYNYDAWKFTRKVFAQHDVLKDYQGKVFWVDADCLIEKNISQPFLENLMGTVGLVFFGRLGFYTETGFIGFDTEADGFKEFLAKYIECLQRGVLFTLRRWHDCEAFDWARSFNLTSQKNLSPWFDLATVTRNDLGQFEVPSDFLDVIGTSELGQYLVHKKGPRKMLHVA